MGGSVQRRMKISWVLVLAAALSVVDAASPVHYDSTRSGPRIHARCARWRASVHARAVRSARRFHHAICVRFARATRAQWQGVRAATERV